MTSICIRWNIHHCPAHLKRTFIVIACDNIANHRCPIKYARCFVLLSFSSSCKQQLVYKFETMQTVSSFLLLFINLFTYTYWYIVLYSYLYIYIYHLFALFVRSIPVPPFTDIALTLIYQLIFDSLGKYNHFLPVRVTCTWAIFRYGRAPVQ